MSRMTKKGAQAVSTDLDKLATLFQDKWAALGIPQKIASDFAYRCDLLSDEIEKRAGLERKALTGDDPVKESGFDPEEISEEKAGPQEQESDEDYMKQHFSQQEKRELSEAQTGSELGPDKTKEDRQVPRAGIQASLVVGDRATKITKAAHAASKSSEPTIRALTRPLTRVARSLNALQAEILSGVDVAGKAARAVKAADHLIPSLSSVSSETASKVTEMAGLAARVADGEGHEVDLLG